MMIVVKIFGVLFHELIIIYTQKVGGINRIEPTDVCASNHPA